MARFVKRGKKYALMDSRQRMRVPFLFDRVEPFHAGYGIGSIDGHGDFLLNDSGHVVFRQAFDRITREGDLDGEDGSCQRHCHYVITHKGHSCLLDLGLHMLVPWGEHEIVRGPSEGIWVIRDPRGKHGYAGMGRIVVPCKFDEAREFGNGHAAVQSRGGKWGVIDALGNWAIPDIYDSMGFVSEGVVGAERDGRAGFLDLAGRVVVPFDFKVVQEFREGVARVQTFAGRWRTIDHAGAFADGIRKCVVPAGLRDKIVSPRILATARQKRRKWFNGLKGHVFSTLKKTNVGYLVHYPGPFTGAGRDAVQKGVQFKLEQKMRDDAWYCSTESGEEEERILEKEKACARRRNPSARPCSGISFYLTETQLSGNDFEEVRMKPRGRGKKNGG